MTISQLVKMLLKDLVDYGDLDVVISTEDDNGKIVEVSLKKRHFGYNLANPDPKSHPLSLYIDSNS